MDLDYFKIQKIKKEQAKIKFEIYMKETLKCLFEIEEALYLQKKSIVYSVEDNIDTSFNKLECTLFIKDELKKRYIKSKIAKPGNILYIFW